MLITDSISYILPKGSVWTVKPADHLEPSNNLTILGENQDLGAINHYVLLVEGYQSA